MPRPTVVVTSRAFAETLALLEARFVVRANTSDEPLDAEALALRARDAQGILAFMPDRIDEALLSRCPELRVIACALKGYDNFDVEACTRRGVWVTIVPDLLTEPTAELTVGLAIGLSRHIGPADRLVRSGAFRGWRPTLYGTSLDGSVVAIIGAGKVGQAIARKLRGFSCEVLMTDANPQAQAPANARRVELDEALPRADFVILAAPLHASSLHMVNAAWLSRLKPGALLVNPARGSLVDEAALADALTAGRLGGYAADVFAFEDWALVDRPVGIDARLLAATDRTLFTTHLGSAVRSVRQDIERDAAMNLIEALRGERPHGAINTVG